MKILVAPDSFKETLSAGAAAEAMARGLHRACPDWNIVTLPMADGGEGTSELLLQAMGGTRVNRVVSGPLGKPVRASFVMLNDGRTAAIDVAAASGLGLVSPEERDPGNAGYVRTLCERLPAP